MELTQTRAKELETLLKENGFEDIAEEMWSMYRKTLAFLHSQLSCNHHFDSVEEYAIKTYGKSHFLKEALENGEARLMYGKMACCNKCGKRYCDTENDILERIKKVENEAKISINIGCTGA